MYAFISQIILNDTILVGFFKMKKWQEFLKKHDISKTWHVHNPFIKVVKF